MGEDLNTALKDVNFKNIQRKMLRERGNNYAWIMRGYGRLSRTSIEH